jgi:hypothetical protein
LQETSVEGGITSPIEYKIYRSDSLVYDTNDYFQITKEENGKRNRIKKVMVSCKDARLDFALSFEVEEGIALSIETDNKDFAYLLHTDVRDYLITEVAKCRSFSFRKILASKISFRFLWSA